MTQTRKNILLILLSAVLVSLVLLSAGLSNLQLQSGVPLPAIESHYGDQGAQSSSGRTFSFTFLQAVLGLLLLFLMIYVPARLLLYVKARWLFRLIQILGLLLLIALFFYFVRFDPGCPGVECSQSGGMPALDAPVLSLANPPRESFYYVGIGLAVALMLLISGLIVRLLLRSRRDSLLKPVEEAVEDMQAGKDVRNVIVQCYSRMASVLQQERGIERESSMTSREFENLLVSRGFEAGPVHQLTSLFEKVRYSQEPMNAKDERDALNCLRAILGVVDGKPHA